MNETNTQRRLRLHLIRHGEVERAAAGKLLGRTDTPLSERGLEQSRQLAEKLAAAHLSAIYSSDLQRARMTAEIIAKRSKLNTQQSSAWRGIDTGHWECRTITSLLDQAPGMNEQLFNDSASFEYPGAQSVATFSALIP